jgi:triosephosphate isomerase
MRYLIGTNIKTYLGYREALSWLAGMDRDIPLTERVDVALFPPLLSLVTGRELINKPNIALGAQNMSFELRGPYTGETSALVLEELHLMYAELGHHERRLYFNETDKLVRRKIELALASGLKALVCVGEDGKYKNSGAEGFVVSQIDTLVKDLSLNSADRLIIAYEPRWAIGVSEAAPPGHARICCDAIRDRLTALLGPEQGEEVRIIYGGSVKLSDAPAMLAEKNVNGLFIGRAALNTSDFAQAVAMADTQAKLDNPHPA